MSDGKVKTGRGQGVGQGKGGGKDRPAGQKRAKPPKPARKRSLMKRIRAPFDRFSASPAVLDRISALAHGYVRACFRRIEWDYIGREELAAHTAGGGAAVMATWHERLLLAPCAWDQGWGEICSLTSAARPGRIVAGMLERFGWRNVGMHDVKLNRTASLQVARLMKSGISVGIACDGPTGPALRMKTIPIDWARISGNPIWLWTYAVTPCRRLKSWDRTLVPLPRGRGVMIYRRWDVEVPRKLTEAETEALRVRLEADLAALTAEAERAVGNTVA